MLHKLLKIHDRAPFHTWLAQRGLEWLRRALGLYRPAQSQDGEIFFALHGAEHVGTMAVTETVVLLLEVATCKSAPRRSASALASNAANLEEESRQWEEEVAFARQCWEDPAARVD